MGYIKMLSMKTIKCPICGKPVKFFEKRKFPPNFPFCSRRCKLIDLGKWLNEEYKITEPIPEGYVPEDLEEDDKN
jgi:endogenous inhibitor of DNA gyrase (YacG/DUF329 family)